MGGITPSLPVRIQLRGVEFSTSIVLPSLACLKKGIVFISNILLLSYETPYYKQYLCVSIIITYINLVFYFSGNVS